MLSDKGVDAEHAPIPMLLAVGAVHHHLIRVGKRMKASLLVETGEAREDHHFATLISFGASLVHPYLAFETVAELAAQSAKDGSSTRTVEAAPRLKMVGRGAWRAPLEDRTPFSWLHNCRRVVTRWERYVENYVGMVQLACAGVLLRATMR